MVLAHDLIRSQVCQSCGPLRAWWAWRTLPRWGHSQSCWQEASVLPWLDRRGGLSSLANSPLPECSQNTAASFPKVLAPKGLEGRNYSVFYGIILEVTYQHFCHILFGFTDESWYVVEGTSIGFSYQEAGIIGDCLMCWLLQHLLVICWFISIKPGR